MKVESPKVTKAWEWATAYLKLSTGEQETYKAGSKEEEETLARLQKAIEQKAIVNLIFPCGHLCFVATAHVSYERHKIFYKAGSSKPAVENCPNKECIEIAKKLARQQRVEAREQVRLEDEADQADAEKGTSKEGGIYVQPPPSINTLDALDIFAKSERIAYHLDERLKRKYANQIEFHIGHILEGMKENHEEKTKSNTRALFLYSSLLFGNKKGSAAETRAQVRINLQNYAKNPADALTQLCQQLDAKIIADRNEETEEQRVERIKRKARAHLKDGKAGKAMQTLTSKAKLHTINDYTKTRTIKKLNANAASPQDSWNTLPQEKQTTAAHFQKVTAAELMQALRDVHGSAAGLDGISKALLKRITKSVTGTSTLLEFFTAYIRGHLPEEVYKFATLGKVVPLTKENGDVRPIVITSVIHRVGASIAASRVKAEAAEVLKGKQFGVALKGGSIIQGHLTKLRLQENAQTRLVSIDIANAFCSVKRTDFSALLTGGLRPLAPLVNRIYGQDTITWMVLGAADSKENNRTWMTADKGVLQGCPLSSMLFALTIQEALHTAAKAGAEKTGWSEHNAAIAIDESGDLHAFIDDVSIVGSSDYLIAAHRSLENSLKELGLTIAQEKSFVLKGNVPGEDHLAKELSKALNIPIREHARIVGFEFGSDASVSDGLQKRARDFKEAADAVSKLTCTLDRYHLTRTCLTARGIWIAQTTLPKQCVAVLGEISLTMKEHIKTITGADSAATRLRTELPLRHGGLGLTTVESVKEAAFIGAVAKTVTYMKGQPNASKTNRLLKQLKEGDYGEAICNALSVLKNKKAAPEEVCNIESFLSEGDENHFSQKTLTMKMEENRYEELKTYLASNNQREKLATLLSASASTASAPFTNYSAAVRSFGNDNDAFLFHLQLVINEPFNFFNKDCPACHEKLTATHALNCNQANIYYPRHEVGKYHIASMARAAGDAVITEHTLQATAADGSKLRMDAVIGRSTVVNKALHIDFSAVNAVGTELQNIAIANFTPALRAARQEVDKIEKYKRAVQEENGVFRPLIIDSVGAMPKASLRELQTLCSRAAANDNHGHGWSKQEWRDDFVCTVLARQAHCVLLLRMGRKPTVIGGSSVVALY